MEKIILLNNNTSEYQVLRIINLENKKLLKEKFKIINSNISQNENFIIIKINYE